MQIQIRGNDLQISEGMRSAAERRADRLDRVVDRVHDAKLELRLDKRRTGTDHVVAQFTLQSGRSLLRAEERNPDAERAIELVMEKMERQARKLHDRVTVRRNGKIHAHEPVAAVENVPDDEDEETPIIVRTKRFTVKPMDPDEAAEQMSLLGHDFFLFQNSETSSVALLYRRRDGQLGMLIPEIG